MIDAYQIGVRLKLDTRGFSAELRSLSAQYEKLQTLGKALAVESKDTTKAIANIARVSKVAAGVVREMSDAMRSFNVRAKVAVDMTQKLGAAMSSQAVQGVKAQEMMAAGQESLARKQRSDTESLSRQQQTAARAQVRATEAHARAEAMAAAQTQRSWGRAYASMQARAARVGSSAGSGMSGVMGGVAAFATGSIVHSALERSTEMDRLGMSMQLYRGNPADRAKMEAAASSLSARRPDMSRLDAMHTFNETVGIIGPENTIAMGDQLADARTRLAQVYGGKVPDNAMQQLLKFAEETNRVYDKDGKVAPEKVAAAFNIAIEAARRSGGMIQLSQLVDAARYSGGMARTMSDDSLMQYLEGQVVTMKGAGTGTSLESMASGILRGKLNKQNLDFLLATGNIDKDKVRHIRGSQLYSVQPGGVTSQAAMMNNPFKWQLEQIGKYAAAKGITQEEAIYQIFPNMRARRGAAQLLNNTTMSSNNFEAQRASLLGPNNENAMRDAQGKMMLREDGTPVLDHAKANAAQAAMLRGGTQGNQVAQLEKALENLSTTLGTQGFKSNVGLLGYLTERLNAFDGWVGAHGNEVREAITLLAGTAGTVGLGMAVGIFARSLGPFMKGAAAVKALELLGGEQGLLGVAKGLEKLFSVFDAIPSWLKSALFGAMAGGAVAGPAGAFVGASGSIGASLGGGLATLTEAQGTMAEMVAHNAAIAAHENRVAGTAPRGLQELLGQKTTDQASASAVGRLSGIPGIVPGFVASMPGSSVPPGALDEATMRMMGVPPAPGGAGAASTRTGVPPASAGPVTNQPISLTVDGKVLARTTARVMGAQASGPSNGYSGFDGRATPTAPGAMPQ